MKDHVLTKLIKENHPLCKKSDGYFICKTIYLDPNGNPRIGVALWNESASVNGVDNDECKNSLLDAALNDSNLNRRRAVHTTAPQSMATTVLIANLPENPKEEKK